MPVEFKEFPKIFRYSRDVVVTEKLDGTNAAVIIEGGNLVGTQSRSRLLTPQDDNYGFSAWAYTHGPKLSAHLGDGIHYGEWWGSGIQRGYGLKRKMFSLFNVSRWAGINDQDIGLSCVPELWRGDMGNMDVMRIMNDLGISGSKAAPGFMGPEGIVIFHTQGNFLLKKTFKKDQDGKGRDNVERAA